MSIFEKIKQKYAKTASTQSENPVQISVDKELLNQIVNKTYPGLGIYVRDVNLSKELAEKYTPGLIIREKAFTDASNRVMGMVTTHRYLILSNHMADFSQFEHGTNWGLHVANSGSRFKVLGTHIYKGKTAIVLLHLLDDDSWEIYKQCQFSVDETVYKMAIERFEKKCEMPPAAELITQAWLERCKFPIGMTDDGILWDID